MYSLCGTFGCVTLAGSDGLALLLEPANWIRARFLSCQSRSHSRGQVESCGRAAPGLDFEFRFVALAAFRIADMSTEVTVESYKNAKPLIRD